MLKKFLYIFLIFTHSINMCGDSDSDCSVVSTGACSSRSVASVVSACSDVSTTVYSNYPCHGDIAGRIRSCGYHPNLFEAIRIETNEMYFRRLNPLECEIYNHQLRIRSEAHDFLTPAEFAIARNNTVFIQWLEAQRWSPLRNGWVRAVVRVGLYTARRTVGDPVVLGRFVVGKPSAGEELK